MDPVFRGYKRSRIEGGKIRTPNMATKVSAYCFTWNNYTDETEEYLHTVYEEQNVQYMCYGREIAPTTGTPHLQGYIKFNSKRSVTAIRKLLKGASIRIAKGNLWHNFDYSSKEDGGFVEYGEKKSKASVRIWRSFAMRYSAGGNSTTSLLQSLTPTISTDVLLPNLKILQ